MTVDYSDLEKFTQGCIESYEDNSILSDISTVEDYNQDCHQGMDFIGVGKRVNLPKRFFSDPSVVTVGIESDVGRAAYKGERDFLLERIRDKAVNGELANHAVNKFDYDTICQILGDEEFTHIFIPWRKNSEDNVIEQMHKHSDAYLTDGELYIDRSIEDVRVHILPTDTGLASNRAYILNKNKIHLTQKKKRDARDPKGMDLIDEYRDIGLDGRLMVYFGEILNSPDDFDFLYRVLLSEPDIEPDGAASIHIPVSE